MSIVEKKYQLSIKKLIGLNLKETKLLYFNKNWD